MVIDIFGKKCKDERDFGLETETETRVVSRPVSSFETTCQKSQYQSQNLRLISKVSVSVSNFETTMQKSQSQSQNAMDGLAHHRFWDPQRKLISRQVFINFFVRMCVQGHMKLFFLLQNLKSQYQSQCLRLMMVSVSVSIFETKGKSLSMSLKFWDYIIKYQSQSQKRDVKRNFWRDIWMN